MLKTGADSAFTRYRAWLALTTLIALAALTACGGGSSGPSPDGPTVTQLAADRSSYFVGEKAVISVSYSGGAGRIEPGIGALASGATIETPVLDHSVTLSLVVDGGGRTVTRSLTLPVSFRNRYVTLNAPFAVSNHASVTAGDGSVLIIGGSRGQSTLSDSIDRFDPATRLFTSIGSMRTGRSGHTATRLPDGRILVLGGLTSLQIGNVADLIDERTGAVADGGQLNDPRVGHAATLLADGRVLVTGGVARDTAEIWDPATNATNAWRLLTAHMINIRQNHTATLLADGRVLIAGGQPGNPADVLAEIFDPRTETFASVPTAVTEMRHLHAAQRLADGSVLLIGGATNNATGAPVALATALRFDPGTGRIDAAAPLAGVRANVRSVLLPDDRVLLLGGEVAASVPTASSESYDRVLGSAAIAPLAAARTLHSVDRLADGRVLIVGGEDASGALVPQVVLYE